MHHFILLAQQTAQVEINFRLSGIIALLAGILILIRPAFLNYIVAAYLIIVGLVQIFNITI
jgi:uncharacterized membrane protein HdeD (DUF308 family)